MNQLFLKLLKQPLLHFLVAATLIFIAYDKLAETPVLTIGYSPKQIVVDRQTLLNFLQYRAKAFEPELFNERLNNMSDAERDSLIAEYVKEEALYREAISMHMEQGDYIIRQRLVQKVDFLLESLIAADIDPTEEELQVFFEARQDDYHIDEVYTFTHIFFNAQVDGMEVAAQRARALLAQNLDIPFEHSTRFGDRYPFLQNYVERTRDFVINNFSESFVADLDALTLDGSLWAGPFASRYGQHLVLLRARTAPRVPELEDIRGRVLDDYRYEMQTQKKREAEALVLEDYDIILDLQ